MKKRKGKKRRKEKNGFVGNRFAERVNVLRGLGAARCAMVCSLRKWGKKLKGIGEKSFCLVGHGWKTRIEKGAITLSLGPNVVTSWPGEGIRTCPLSLRLRGGLFLEHLGGVRNGDIGKCEILGDEKNGTVCGASCWAGLDLSRGEKFLKFFFFQRCS